MIAARYPAWTMLLLLFWTSLASAEQAGAQFGTVWRVRGDVLAVSPAGQVRRLAAEARVYAGEKIRAVSQSEVVIRTADAGLIAVRPNTEFVAETYRAKDTPADQAIFKLLRGSLRIVSGWIGKMHNERFSVKTPTATLGVRGTDFEPFVLEADAAADAKADPGTYNKVNQGLTTLASSVGQIEVPAGKVGFVADPGAKARGKKPTDRALMTLLMPRLLDTVPGFYMGGDFEKDIDQFSAESEEQRRKEMGGQAAAALPCNPKAIADIWVRRLDDAVERRDSDAVLKLFADDTTVEATVIGGDGGEVKQSLDRATFVSSVTTAMAGVTDFSQKRTPPAVEAEADAAKACSQVRFGSHVIEQGRMSGKPYRVESDERYVLEKRNGAWVAVEASTKQK